MKDNISWALFDFLAFPLLIIAFLLVPLWRLLEWKQNKQKIESRNNEN